MICDSIKALREDRDLRQREISEMLGVAQTTDSQYETGKIPWTDEILIKLALFYGVSVDYLLGLTDEKSPYPRRKGKLHP